MRLSPLAAAILFTSIALAQTTPPLTRPDANAAANAGRTQLHSYLDHLAEQHTAARRTAIASITTRAQAEARQQEVRNKILALIGGLPEKTPLNPRMLGITQLDGFRIEKVLFDSQPNFPVTALLYLPDNPAAKLPAIVIAPGHSVAGKASDYAFAATFARNGFAVLSYDPIGQGERLQYPDPAHPNQSLAGGPTGEHGEAGLQPTLIGDAAARTFAWDGIRAVDYLLSRPEIDPSRIGAFGCSGGGAMTALLGALDPRVAAIATACYITSFDTLLPALGAQDAEQSTPNFIDSGLDFPDWIELAAPRPYAVVGTVGDMFPWKGLLASATEARHFYSLFDPTAEGTSTGAPLPPTPIGPTLNPDTANTIAPTAPFQVIAGIGGHANLRPLTAQIVSFFLIHLAHSTAETILPQPTTPPANGFQVTPTGQVATSYPGSETVHTLTLKRAAKLPKRRRLSIAELQTAIRSITRATAQPGPLTMTVKFGGGDPPAPTYTALRLTLPTEPGITIHGRITLQAKPARRAAVLMLVPDVAAMTPAESATFDTFAKAGNMVLAITPRPSPPGTGETKSPLLGPFYLTELRAELVGKTILGMRIDDVVQALNYLAARADVDSANITAVASEHLGLVLLHTAVLDPRLRHITVDHMLESYRALLAQPLPVNAPQDILPAVLLHYDIPDLTRALGKRVTVNK